MFNWLWESLGWKRQEIAICKDTICQKEVFWQKNDKTYPSYISSVLEKFKAHGYDIKYDNQ